MNSKTGGNGSFQGMGWVGGSAVVLLLIGAGLAQFAHQALGQAGVAAILLALYLASWLYVLGIVGLVLLPVWRLVGWLHVRATRAALRSIPLRLNFFFSRAWLLMLPANRPWLVVVTGMTPSVSTESPKRAENEKTMSGSVS